MYEEPVSMKIDLHIHTSHSFDSDNSVEAVLQSASRVGLDAIAICDHNTMSAVGLAQLLCNDVIVIPGMELTTDRGTHLIGLFLNDEIVSRDILGMLTEIHSQKGLVMLPHPYRPHTGLWFNRDKENLYSGAEVVQIMQQIDLVEAVNYHSTPDEIIDVERHLRMMKAMPQGGGSDAHSIDDIGKAYVDLENVSGETLDYIKEALICSPRYLRYEAYSELEGHRTLSVSQSRPKSRIGYKTREVIETILPESMKNIYRKSRGKLVETGESDASETVS